MSETYLVRPFQKPQPKNSMHSQSRVNDPSADGLSLALSCSATSARFISATSALIVNHLVRPESIWSFSLAAAWAAASRAVSTRNGEHET